MTSNTYQKLKNCPRIKTVILLPSGDAHIKLKNNLELDIDEQEAIFFTREEVKK